MSENPLIHALIIADNNGNFLVDLIRNEHLEAARLSGFISALRMFGEETLGKIRDIAINGLDIDMLVVSKYKLVMIAIMDSDLPGLDFRAGCERALEVFHKIFKDQIRNWDGSLNTFKDFRELLQQQVDRYFSELKEYQEEHHLEKLEFDELRNKMVKINNKTSEKLEELNEEMELPIKRDEEVILKSLPNIIETGDWFNQLKKFRKTVD